MRPGGLLAVMLLLLPLAGCVTDPAMEAPPPAAPAEPALVFGPAVAMEQPSAGAEPNMAILPDGTVFITAVAGSQEKPNANEGAAWLWVSRDGGASWETIRAPARDTPLGTLPGTRKPFGSSDADVVASADGWVYYSDWWLWGAPVAGTPRAGNYLVERSSDGGASWEATPVTIPDVTSVDRQWLVAGADGFVGLFYAYFETVENALGGTPAGDDFVMSIKAVFSRDHAASFGDGVSVVPTEPGVAYQIGHPWTLPDGAIVMPYARVPLAESYWRDPGQVMAAVSRDGGASWEQVAVADVPEGFDNLWAVQGAADEAGNFFVAWASRVDDARMDVRLARSADGGASWGAPVVLRAEGLNYLPWVAARGDGQVAVGWYGGNATGDPTDAPGDAEWFAFVAEIADGAPPAVGHVSEEPVKVGPLCPRGASCTDDRELLDYVSLIYDGEGRLHYAFAKSREVDGAKIGHVHYARESS